MGEWGVERRGLGGGYCSKTRRRGEGLKVVSYSRVGLLWPLIRFL